MRDKDTSALREIFQYSIFNIPHHCDPYLNQTKLNGLLPLTIPGVLVATGVYALLLKFLQKNSPHNVQTKGGGSTAF